MKQRRAATLLDSVTKYARAVVAGKIVAGPDVRATCRRHIKDLKRKDIAWDLEASEHVIGFFPAVLRLSEGQFDGIPFELHESQKFIVGSIFGWKRLDGTRRYRRAYIEIGKGNGKSPLAAGIGLFGLVADGEAGAQIYAGAAKKDQADIMFQDAVKMVRQSPELSGRILNSGKSHVWNMADLKTGSFFKPISRESGKTGSGPRPHFALCDEVHEHPDRFVMEMLERGFKFRRQPLLLMTTNSGSDRNSVCWEEHCHAVAVAHGDIEDDTTFSYVCGMDNEPRTELYSLDIALRHVIYTCTCNAQITQIDPPSPQDFVQLVINESVGSKISRKDLGAITIQTVSLLLDAFAILATQDLGMIGTQPAPKNAGRICANIQKARDRWSLAVNETPNTGKRKKNQTQIGKSTALGSTNTGSPRSNLTKSKPHKAEAAEFVEQSLKLSEWITATMVAMFGDCSAISAMQELVCSEILSRLYNEHSTTCKTHQQCELTRGGLKVNLPADDPLLDPKCWVKANPLLGVILQEEYLKDVCAQALAIPGKMNGILRLHFCMWTDSETAWIARSVWEACEDPDMTLDEFEGKRFWGGLDLSSTKDMTAYIKTFEDGETEDGRPKFAVFCNAYTPSDTLLERARTDRAPYDVWVRDGFLNATAGPKVRYDYVAADIVADAEMFDCQAIAYDRYLIKHFEDALDAMGATLQLVEHPQGLGQRKDTELWMPDSIDKLETLIMEKRVRIQVNPVLRSAVASACFYNSPAGLRRFEKQRATSRIDCAVAMAMSVGAAVYMNDMKVASSPWDDPEFSIAS